MLLSTLKVFKSSTNCFLLVILLYPLSSGVKTVSLFFCIVKFFSEKASIVIFVPMAQHSGDIPAYDQFKKEGKDWTLYRNTSGRLHQWLILNKRGLSRKYSITKLISSNSLPSPSSYIEWNLWRSSKSKPNIWCYVWNISWGWEGEAEWLQQDENCVLW